MTKPLPLARPASGFTLVEFILALALGSLVMLAAFLVFRDQYESVKAQKTVGSVLELFEQADRGYAMNSLYTTSDGVDVSFPALYALANRAPQGVMVTAGGSGTPAASAFKNVWGGTYTVAAANSPAGTKDLMTVSLSQVPLRACINLITALAPQSYDTYVNGTLVGLLPTPTALDPGRGYLNVNQALGLCQPTNTVLVRHLKPLNFLQMRAHPMGSTMTAAEAAFIAPQYARVQAAMDAREAAQAAIP